MPLDFIFRSEVQKGRLTLVQEMIQSLLLLALNLLSIISIISSQSSPCPQVFQYQSDGQRNYGIITIPGPGEGRTVMQASVAVRGQIFDMNSGGLKLLKSLDDSVEDARRGRNVQYILNFPRSEQLPIIKKLSLNYRDICNGPQVNNLPTWSFQHEFTYPKGLTQLSFVPKLPSSIPEPDLLDSSPWFNDPPIRRPTPAPQPPRPQPEPVPKPQPPRVPQVMPPIRPGDASWLSRLPTAGTCGQRGVDEEKVSTQLIIGGEGVNEGEFPWMVAMFHFEGRRPVYKCGASLLTNSYVITAAHCTKNQRRVYLELGRHNISNPDEDGYITRISLNIIAHPEYESGAHGDVALVLIERVEFTPKIRPICLWAQGTNFDRLLRVGTVTGWGRVENDGDLSTIPMKLNVRTVGLDACRNSNEKLKDIATDKTFCAGGNLTGPCHGDSGSGFYIRHKEVWFLRGIISTSLGNDFVCNLGEYAVYVDLVFYMDWLRLYLLRS